MKERRVMFVAGALMLVCASRLPAAGASPTGAAKAVRSLGVKWLVAHQDKESGAYGKAGEARVGTTGLVVYTLASCQRGYQVVDGPYMSEAVAFLLKRANEDGSFGKSEDETVRRFNTALAVKALAALKTSKTYQKEIDKGLAFLARTSGNKPEDEVWGGLGSVWPETPGPICRTLLQNLVNVRMGKGGAWLTESVKTLTDLQDRADDTADTYGMCTSPAKEGLETDSVVATALAVKAADLVKDNYKRLEDKG